MQRLVSLREANQHLSQYIHIVEQGDEVIITRRGKPVAKMIPLIDSPLLSSEHEQKRQKLNALMKKGLSLKGEIFSREQVHER